MVRWTSSNIPSQRGRSALVTGQGGLGFEDALALVRAGAEVILAGRNVHKGMAAVEKIREAVPTGKVSFEVLDLANLRSVADCAHRLRDQRDSLDILINNAGVMVPPQRLETVDGFELQLGTNYLGHFALTGHLMPLLRQTRSPRVITLSSIAARNGVIDFNDLNAEKRYRPMTAYSQSKLACLIFALELQRRSVAAGWGIDSMGAHPGVARTDLLHNAPGRYSAMGLTRSLFWFAFQPVAQGALPTLFAATSPLAKAGAYYGPDQWGEVRGYPSEARFPPRALDTDVAERLWSISEAMTGVRFT